MEPSTGERFDGANALFQTDKGGRAERAFEMG